MTAKVNPPSTRIYIESAEAMPQTQTPAYLGGLTFFNRPVEGLIVCKTEREVT